MRTCVCVHEGRITVRPLGRTWDAGWKKDCFMMHPFILLSILPGPPSHHPRVFMNSGLGGMPHPQPHLLLPQLFP